MRLKHFILLTLLLVTGSLFIPSVTFAQKADGADCTNDFECQSGRCIVNSIGQRVCANRILSPEQIGIGAISVPVTANININDTIIDVINFLLGAGSVVFLVVFLYGAFLWLSSAGDKANFERARNTMTYAGIGVALLACTFAAFQIITAFLLTNRTPPLPPPPGCNAQLGQACIPGGTICCSGTCRGPGQMTCKL